MGWQRQKKEVVQAARKLLERGLVTATSGNVSVRLPTKDGSAALRHHTQQRSL